MLSHLKKPPAAAHSTIGSVGNKDNDFHWQLCKPYTLVKKGDYTFENTKVRTQKWRSVLIFLLYVAPLKMPDHQLFRRAHGGPVSTIYSGCPGNDEV